MFIRHLHVKNWMIHKDTSVELFPITVFVGFNNGGKSALFEALVNFSMVSRGRLSQAFGPGPHSYAERRHHGASPSARVGYTVEMAESPDAESALRYEITYSKLSGSGPTPRYEIKRERLTDLLSGKVVFDRDEDICRPKSVSQFVGDETSFFAAIRRAQVEAKYAEADPLVTHCAREISRVGRYRLEPMALARPSRLPDTAIEGPGEPRAPRLDYSGEGLAGVLYYLHETGQPSLEALSSKLSEFVSGFAGFDFNLVGTDRIGFSVKFDDPRSTVSAINLSHGTLSLIGTLTLLLDSGRPPIMCIEEPENGLTPRSLQAVYEAMCEAAEPERGGTQFLVSSHSPFVICEAWNGEERDFIYQVKPVDGRALVRSFAAVLGEHGVMLAKDSSGERTRLNLNMANLVMDGYMS